MHEGIPKILTNYGFGISLYSNCGHFTIYKPSPRKKDQKAVSEIFCRPIAKRAPEEQNHAKSMLVFARDLPSVDLLQQEKHLWTTNTKKVRNVVLCKRPIKDLCQRLDKDNS